MSPVKKHAKSEHHQRSDAKKKLQKVEENVQNFKYNLLGSPSFNNADERKAAMEKANWFH